MIANKLAFLVPLQTTLGCVRKTHFHSIMSAQSEDGNINWSKFSQNFQVLMIFYLFLDISSESVEVLRERLNKMKRVIQRIVALYN